ncbi:GNAT family N-acetyltransferase [Limosilactobacillus antri]|uniref:GNAT family N-acetyltransferase n=1 Tax=Limosilactobacillus antri TaxID=227943 RepID=UPI001F58D364|nr:GNAT family N-acetyltransferase [Limosilactobacillus antri]
MEKAIMSIRRAHASDWETIINIFNEAVAAGIATDESSPITVADRAEWFAQFDDRHPLWVITVDGAVRGWCALEYFYPNPAYADTAEIAIYIQQQAHRQGLGRRLLAFADQQIRDRLHFRTIVAYIYERNRPSQALFKQNGFSYWGRLPAIAKVAGEYRELKIYGKNYPSGRA